jgi:ketosteroid isomerase-like protein
MSQENIEIVREFVLLDLDEAMTRTDPAIVWNPTEEPPCHGRDAVRASLERWESDWDDLEQAPEEFIDAEDRVFVAIRFRGRGRGSGIEIHNRLFEVYTLREGAIVRMDEFTDRGAALEAAGLPE